MPFHSAIDTYAAYSILASRADDAAAMSSLNAPPFESNEYQTQGDDFEVTSALLVVDADSAEENLSGNSNSPETSRSQTYRTSYMAWTPPSTFNDHKEKATSTDFEWISNFVSSFIWNFLLYFAIAIVAGSLTMLGGNQGRDK